MTGPSRSCLRVAICTTEGLLHKTKLSRKLGGKLKKNMFRVDNTKHIIVVINTDSYRSCFFCHTFFDGLVHRSNMEHTTKAVNKY